MSLYVQLIFLLLICLAGLIYLIESWRFKGSKLTVYMGSDLSEIKSHLRDIIKKYLDNETSSHHLYEPGSGLAFVADWLSQNYSWKSVTALELRPTVYGLAKVRAFLKNSQLRLKRQDIFTYTPKTPGFTYCYLNSAVLKGLYEKGKFKNQLVVCLTFEIEGAEPKETIQLQGWQKTLRVYNFTEKRP